MLEKDFFSDFKGISKEEWIKKIESDIKSKEIVDFDWEIQENQKISAFYHSEDIYKERFPFYSKKDANDWAIGADIFVNDFGKTNELTLELLDNGMDSPCFYLSDSLNEQSIEILLNNIDLSIIFSVFDCASVETYDVLTSFIKSNYKTAGLKGAIYCNDKLNTVENYTQLNNDFPNFLLFSIESNKSKVEDSINHMIHQLDDLYNLTGDKNITDKVSFQFHLDDNYFLNIAMIRAFKLVLAHWHKSNEMELSTPYITVQLSKNAIKEDAYQNMIQNPSIAISAAIAGVNRISLSSKFEYDGLDITFIEQTRLNVQHILKLESYLTKIIDPASGSYFIETLTTNIAKKAWSIF